MCIYISTETIVFLFFIIGVALGWLIHKVISASREPIDYYDGTHGMGYQPKANKELNHPPKPLHSPHK